MNFKILDRSNLASILTPSIRSSYHCKIEEVWGQTFSVRRIFVRLKFKSYLFGTLIMKNKSFKIPDKRSSKSCNEKDLVYIISK